MFRSTALIVLFGTCFSVAAAEPPATQLRLHGSNTIGARLAPALVRAYAATQGYAVRDAIARGEESSMMLERDGSSVHVEIHAHGTGTGFSDLLDRSADVWMASRPVTATELAQGAPLGPLDSPANEHVVALDGLAILVHPSNPLAELSLAQVADVFSGRTTNWASLGGRPGRITRYARDDKSGTYDTFKSLVLRGAALSPDARRYESSERLAGAVAADPAAIGFTGLATIGAARAIAVSEAGTRALEPDRISVATEDYALSRRLFLYHAATPPAHVVAFVEFALGPAGQAIAEQTGFVAQEVQALPLPPRDDIGGEYAALTRGATRLSVNFRFSSAVSYLDTKALRDVDRLVAWLRRHPGARRELMLFGFADGNEANPVQALVLSADRADFVATMLVARDVPPRRVRGVGDAAPVAENATPNGRARNRRVEVWIRDAPATAAAVTDTAKMPPPRIGSPAVIRP